MIMKNEDQVSNNNVTLHYRRVFEKEFVKFKFTIFILQNHWLIRAMECYYHCMNHLKEYGTLLMKRVINAKLAGVYLNLANKNMACKYIFYFSISFLLKYVRS